MSYQDAATAIKQRLVSGGDLKAREAFDGSSFGHGHYVFTSVVENVGQHKVEVNGQPYTITVELDTLA